MINNIMNVLSEKAVDHVKSGGNLRFTFRGHVQWIEVTDFESFNAIARIRFSRNLDRVIGITLDKFIGCRLDTSCDIEFGELESIIDEEISYLKKTKKREPLHSSNKSI